MEVNVIVLSTRRFQERHLICDLLTKQGHKITCLFYGGAGGGKKAKSTQVVLGNSLLVNLKSNRKGSLYSSSQWEVNWFHSHIQHSYKAYYLILFFLEIMNRISIPSDDEDFGNQKNFGLLSNSLFYVEDSLKKEQFSHSQHLGLFLVKLLHESGFFPDYNYCQSCNNSLNKLDYSFNEVDHGFLCSKCHEVEFKSIFRESLELRKTLHLGATTFYKNYESFQDVDSNSIRTLYLYFFKHYEIVPQSLKTYNFQFSS